MDTQSWSRDPSPPVPLSGLPSRGSDMPLVTLSYGAGEPIYLEGDPVESLYIVISGSVRTARHALDGRRQVGGFYLQGDLFGFEPGNEHAYSAEALERTLVKVVSRSAVRPDTGVPAVLAAATAELDRAHQHLCVLGRRSAGERLAAFILEIAARAGAGVARLPMSRQDIGDYLGLANETVSRLFTQFQSQGLVAFANCRELRILRAGALRQLAEG